MGLVMVVDWLDNVWLLQCAREKGIGFTCTGLTPTVQPSVSLLVV